MTQDPTTEYINSLVEQVLNSGQYQELEEQKREEIRGKLQEHFHNIIIDTAVNRMTDDQVEELNNALEQGGEKTETKMTELSAQIPGLAEDIEERLNREAEQLQKLGSE